MKNDILCVHLFIHEFSVAIQKIVWKMLQMRIDVRDELILYFLIIDIVLFTNILQGFVVERMEKVVGWGEEGLYREWHDFLLGYPLLSTLPVSNSGFESRVEYYYTLGKLVIVSLAQG